MQMDKLFYYLLGFGTNLNIRKTETVTISIPLKWWYKLKSTELLFVGFN